MRPYNADGWDDALNNADGWYNAQMNGDSYNALINQFQQNDRCM